MRYSSVFQKLLTLVLIAGLLWLPLAGVTAEPFFTSIQDAPPEFAFTVNDNEEDGYYLLKTEPDLSYRVELAPAEELRIAGDGLQASLKPAMTVLPLKDIISAIFIPPKSVS